MAFTDQEKRAIGKSVRRLRKARGWTQRDLAAAAPASPATLSKIENGKAADDPYTLSRIARALNVGVDDLLTGARRTTAADDRPARYTPEWFVWYREHVGKLPEPARSMGLKAADEAERWIEQLSDFDPSKV